MQQKMLLGLILTLFTIVFTGVYWIMEPARQEAASKRQHDEAIERGMERYSSYCSNCHGTQGEGGVGPALRGTSLDSKVLIKIVSRGISGTAMSAWAKEENGSLNKQQIEDLVIFIKNWETNIPATETTLAPTATEKTKPSSSQTTPSTINAGELFTNTCSACHGQNREGVSGLAPALTPETLAELTDDQLSDLITNGRLDTAMMGFNATLSLDEIAALVQLIKYTSP